MNTAKERINALAAIVPNDMITLLNAHLCTKNAANEVYKSYTEAFPSEGDVDGRDLYLSDGCCKNLEDVEDTLWHRACIALENWIYETYYDEE